MINITFLSGKVAAAEYDVVGLKVKFRMISDFVLTTDDAKFVQLKFGYPADKYGFHDFIYKVTEERKKRVIVEWMANVYVPGEEDR